jgi:hypothetical protein
MRKLEKFDGRAMRLEQILQMIPPDPLGDIPALYGRLSVEMTSLDCGKRCAPHNPSGKPFCCDICHAVPAAYRMEWDYLQTHTDLWHLWRGDECQSDTDTMQVRNETPKGMVLLACEGPAECQRTFRALSCRQFPFFPYVTEDYRFIGLAYEWEFEDTCWVISHLGRVNKSYRARFVDLHDNLFAQRQEVFENYAAHSKRMRSQFKALGRCIPLLHRNGGNYLVSPASGRIHKAAVFPRFGPYRLEN